MPKTKPQRVTWSSDDEIELAILASMGFSRKMIMDRTGFSPCQVGYRMKKANIKLADYRNGESAMAERILERHRPPSHKAARDMLNLKVVK